MVNNNLSINKVQIQKFKITGFKSINRTAMVSFPSEKATIIYGDNGCGKTTFLKAISSFLAQDDSALNDLDIKSIDCEIEHNNKTQTVIVKKQENGYNWENFNLSPLANTKSLSLGVERGVSTQTTTVDPEYILEFLTSPKISSVLGHSPNRTSHSSRRQQFIHLAEELSRHLRLRQSTRSRYRRQTGEIDTSKPHLYLQNIKIENIEELLLHRYRIAKFTATKKIQSALFDTIAVAINTEENSNFTPKNIKNDDLADRLLENRNRIKEALDNGEDNNFKSKIISILNSIDDKKELQKVIEHNLLSQLFKNMLDELEMEKLILGSINLLVSKFNNYLINEKKLIVNEYEIFIEIDENKHSLNDLSSGERHILTFLALVLFEGRDRDFLIIDEPEISLNIKWQRDLISIFSELLPETQIIVASHSPAIAKRNPNFLSKLNVWRD